MNDTVWTLFYDIIGQRYPFFAHIKGKITLKNQNYQYGLLGDERVKKNRSKHGGNGAEWYSFGPWDHDPECIEKY